MLFCHLGSHKYQFVDMQNIVHVDEKWFYVHRNRNTYYLTSDETAPRAVTKNKNHRTKVMFLVAVARPGTTPTIA
jgi:hypothetical protein